VAARAIAPKKRIVTELKVDWREEEVKLSCC
jgi:hypothetical protein